MEDNNENIETVAENAEKLKVTLDELLKDPELQSQFDKKAEGMKKKWEAAWQKKSEEDRIEAEKLARMSEEEKGKLAISKANERAQKAEMELNAYKLKDEAKKIAKEKELDTDFLDVFDYSKETAESIKQKVDFLSGTVNKVLEKRTNELMKQSSPKQVHMNESSKEKMYLDEKYRNNRFYKK